VIYPQRQLISLGYRVRKNWHYNWSKLATNDETEFHISTCIQETHQEMRWRTWTFYGDIFNHYYAVRPGSYRIQWNKAKWTLRRSRSFEVTDFYTNRKLTWDFLLVINTNLPPILHRFWDIAFDRPKISPLAFNSPTEGFPCNDLCKIFSGCQRMAKVPNGVETLPKISTGWVGCTSVIDRRQTDGRQHIANVNVNDTFAKS